MQQVIKGLSGFFEVLAYKLFKKPPFTVKTNFFRLLAVAQESGLGMRESLRSIMMAEKNPSMVEIIKDMLDDINEGRSLAYAVGCHPYFFSTNEVELIRAAEKMGNLPTVLQDIATELENTEKINAKIKKAIMYPAGLLGFTIVAVIVLLVFVIPVITELYGDPSKLPEITKFMIGASDFLQTTRWMLIVFFIGFLIAFKILYSNVIVFKKYVDLFLLKIPKVNDTIKTFYMYSFSKLFGDFGKAGVAPTEALEQLVRIFNNYHYKAKILSMRQDLENGFTISDSVEGSELFDPILIQIIIVGEKTGNLSSILLTMSKFYRFQLEGKIDGLTSMIEPIMMAIIAAVIGTIVASIFLPMAGLLDQLGGM